jgi:DNA-binding NarL/FixJ family response regulator
MLTVYGDTDHIFQSLAVGASGYLLKSTLRDQLAAAIREVHGGGSPMTSDVARKVVQSFHRASPRTSPEYALSGRERTVLDRLSVGYLYKEIAAEMGVSLATVSTYVRRIYVKLQVRSRAQAVAKVMINK